MKLNMTAASRRDDGKAAQNVVVTDIITQKRRRELQRERVLEFLERGHTLTMIEGIELLGVLHLASRISELKKAGYPIEREMIPVGRAGAMIARYRLRPLADEAGEAKEGKPE